MFLTFSSEQEEKGNNLPDINLYRPTFLLSVGWAVVNVLGKTRPGDDSTSCWLVNQSPVVFPPHRLCLLSYFEDVFEIKERETPVRGRIPLFIFYLK